MKPQILFEDKYFIAINKNAPMIVNNADSAKNVETLQDFISTYLKDNLTAARNIKNKDQFIINGYSKVEEFISRSGIVHRLDKETSGVILVAKDVATFINLQNQFKSKTIQKKYIALVHGSPEKNGEINQPIGRLPWNRMRFGVLQGGREALTQYTVLTQYTWENNKKNENLTLVEVIPQTGRTHQIRVHFQFIKAPIFSDELYSGRKTGRNDRQSVGRHFLHASQITLHHPETQERMTITAPLPDELSSFLSTLKKVDE